MCGRYTITVSLEELMLFFSVDQPNVPFHIPRYNVAPMQMVPAILNDGERNRLGELRWGLVPVWAKDPKIGNQVINARSETITEKPAFRGILTRKRCVIPADGFYEWKQEEGKKQPYRIVLRSRTVFGFAGLYDTWTGPNGEKISTCTIITTAPNELMVGIHDRMPVILQKEEEEAWLDRGNQDKDFLQSMLRPYDASDMYAYPVGTAVGNVRNNSPELIEAIG